MRVKKFRIRNYKSIIDSGDCYLTDTITILAGKNESGKTSILEALENFNINRKIPESARPIDQSTGSPGISITFVVPYEIVKHVLAEINHPQKVQADVELEIIKVLPNEYSLGESTMEGINVIHIVKLQDEILDLWDGLLESCPKFNDIVPNLRDNDFAGFAFDSTVRNHLARIITSLKDGIVSNFPENSHTDTLLETLGAIQEKKKHVDDLIGSYSKLLEALKKFVPNFILFNSFEDVFPNEVPLAELHTNKWIQDLALVSDLKPTIIQKSPQWEKHKHKNEVNLSINEDYEKFWKQDRSKLSVDWDSETLCFWIEENGHPYAPSLRSKGRQWHLAFYIKVSARAKENIPNIILIDEPGLYLHAKAQEDILRKLESSSKEVQLMFSTHSPYLLEAEKLNRIKLVQRTRETGTRIENKVHASADKETLTPILTAIGLELNLGINDLGKERNVVVEGPSDMYYLNAFKKLFDLKDVNFVFGGGTGNMPFVGTILHGWGLKVLYLCDNDKGKKDGAKNLKKKWLVTKDLILSILPTNGSVEDVFSTDDFKKYVLDDESKIYSGANSEHVKEAGIEKVLLAKYFLEKCQDGRLICLDQTTEENITTLFEKIKAAFKNL